MHSRPPAPPSSSEPAPSPTSDAPAGAGAASAAQPAASATLTAAPQSHDPVYNLPNGLSVARLLSGPYIAYLIIEGQWSIATALLAVSAASDWLDGLAARVLRQSSVLGSYLDPLADKVLVCCVAGALLARGSLPVWLASVIVGRDVLLVAGMFAHRFHTFGWRWPGREQFFRTAEPSSGSSSVGASEPAGAVGSGAGTDVGSAALDAEARGGVPLMQPLLISKLNTVLQMVLLGAYMLGGWAEGESIAGGDPYALQHMVPDQWLVALPAAVTSLEYATATTTVVSGLAYVVMYASGATFKRSRWG